MVSRWCVVEGGLVVNVIMWDGDPKTWQPPAGQTVVAYDPALPMAPLSAATLNERTVRSALLSAMQGNRDYRAIAVPTVLQQTAQIDSLTRQVTALERMALNQFENTN